MRQSRRSWRHFSVRFARGWNDKSRGLPQPVPLQVTRKFRGGMQTEFVKLRPLAFLQTIHFFASCRLQITLSAPSIASFTIFKGAKRRRSFAFVNILIWISVCLLFYCDASYEPTRRQTSDLIRKYIICSIYLLFVIVDSGHQLFGVRLLDFI